MIQFRAKPLFEKAGATKIALRTALGVLLFAVGLVCVLFGWTTQVALNRYTSALGVPSATVVAISSDVKAMGEEYERAAIEEKYGISTGRLSLKAIPDASVLQARVWMLVGGMLLMVLALLIPYTGKYILNYAVLFVVVFPFFWMVLASFKNNVDIIDATRNMFDFTPTLKNYGTVFGKYNFIRPTINSFYVATVSTALALIIGLPAAYSVARFKLYKLSLCILVVRMIPGITFLVPWYMIFLQLGLTNTFSCLILSHMLVALPFIIWIMVPFFDNIPRELEEAVWVDGCAQWLGFFKIILPVSIPGILTGSLLAFIFSWNNFMFSLTLSGSRTTTLPIAIYGFVSYASVDWGGLMAAATVITLPIIVISLLTQRHIISGLTAGAVKG